MIRKIKKLIKKVATEENPNIGKRKFTFMLEQGKAGKSVSVYAVDREAAEAELKEIYPDYSIQFLWEW